MATQVRRDASRFGKPSDSRGKNRAITSIMAEGVHDQRVTNLRRTEKQLGRKAKAAGASLEGSADAATRYGEATAGQTAALQRQNSALQELARRNQREMKSKATSAAFHAKFPGYANLSKKEQEKRWRNYTKGLASSVSYNAARKAYEAKAKAITGRSVQQQRLMTNYRRQNKRATRLQRQYVKANEALRKASQVVRWSP